MLRIKLRLYLKHRISAETTSVLEFRQIKVKTGSILKKSITKVKHVE